VLAVHYASDGTLARLLTQNRAAAFRANISGSKTLYLRTLPVPVLPVRRCATAPWPHLLYLRAMPHLTARTALPAGLRIRAASCDKLSTRALTVPLYTPPRWKAEEGSTLPFSTNTWRPTLYLQVSVLRLASTTSLVHFSPLPAVLHACGAGFLCRPHRCCGTAYRCRWVLPSCLRWLCMGSRACIPLVPLTAFRVRGAASVALHVLPWLTRTTALRSVWDGCHAALRCHSSVHPFVCCAAPNPLPTWDYLKRRYGPHTALVCLPNCYST